MPPTPDPASRQRAAVITSGPSGIASDVTAGTDAATQKATLRRTLLATRRTRPPERRTQAARPLGDAVLLLPEVQRCSTVACYVAVSTEPPTADLLERLVAAGKRVLLPLVQPDGDLDWAAYAGPAALGPGPRGLTEPTGRRLGPTAVSAAAVVIVPGLAVGADGVRLGRGGGSYDRVLARVSAQTLVVMLLWDGELLDSVPTEPHDSRVDVVVTPALVRRFPRAPRAAPRP